MIGADDPDRLARDGAVGLDSQRRGDAEIGGPLIRRGGVGAKAEVLHRTLELGGGGQHPGSAHFGDGQVAELVDVVAHGGLQLPNAAHPQLGVGGPVGVVECAAGGLDRSAHVVGARVGGGTEHLLGSRVQRRERPRAAGDEFPVDEQLALAIGQHPHSDSRFDCWTAVRLCSLER